MITKCNRLNKLEINNEVKRYYNQKVAEKQALEQDLRQVNVVITNFSNMSGGSGVNIKYRESFYILSAAHLLDEENDIIFIQENEIITLLEVVKIDVLNDLVLFRPKDTYIPNKYIELNNFVEPKEGTEIYIIGNPANYEDVIEEGRVITYEAEVMYITGTVWFGNSGGGAYTKDGRLVGIASFITAAKANDVFNAYMIGGMIRLNVIEKFLSDIVN